MSEPVIDSLPYIDQISEENEQYALSLVEAELKKGSSRSSNKAEKLPPIHFRTDLMKYEYENRGKGDRFVPTMDDLEENPKAATAEDWATLIQRAKIAYERERIRAQILQVDKEGCATESWKSYNLQLSKYQEYMDGLVSREKNAVEDINHSRQQEQQLVGQELDRLSYQHAALTQKRKQLKEAIAVLKAELADS